MQSRGASSPASSRRQSAKVQASIDRLSPKLRATVTLRYLEGLSYGDIAEVMECSIGTVKSRLNRAHGNLEEFLKPVVDVLSGRDEGDEADAGSRARKTARAERRTQTEE